MNPTAPPAQLFTHMWVLLHHHAAIAIKRLASDV